jgi:hypothetical protein
VLADVPTALAQDLEQRLAELGTPERAEKERAYLKSELRHLGTSVPAIRRTVRELLREHPELDRDAITGLVDALWSEPVVAWLEPRLDRASGLTIREAVKHLPSTDRERFLARLVPR